MDRICPVPGGGLSVDGRPAVCIGGGWPNTKIIFLFFVAIYTEELIGCFKDQLMLEKKTH